MSRLGSQCSEEASGRRFAAGWRLLEGRLRVRIDVECACNDAALVVSSERLRACRLAQPARERTVVLEARNRLSQRQDIADRDEKPVNTVCHNITTAWRIGRDQPAEFPALLSM